MVCSLPRYFSDAFLYTFQAEKAKIRGNEAKYLEQFLATEEKYASFEKLQKSDLSLTSEQFTRAETISNRIETEIDRKAFCDQILKNINDSANVRFEPSKTGQSFSTEKQATRIYDKIVVSTLICDFGNVVVNSVKKKTLKLFNTGALPADIVFDSKAYKSQGYTITPEKIMKMPPEGSASIVISYQAKKNSRFGLQVTSVPLEVKNGPKYTLELRANVTIPEITLETLEVNPDVIDFQNVIIG